MGHEPDKTGDNRPQHHTPRVSRGGINRLSATQVRTFAAKARPGAKAFDGHGLYLLRTAGGGASWRVKYRLAGVEKLYSVGLYPSVTLDVARAQRDAVRVQIAQGIDPVRARQLRRVERTASNAATFDALAADYLAAGRREWTAGHHARWVRAFDRDVLPTLGALPTADITPAIVAMTVERILKRGVVEAATKTLQHISGCFLLAMARGVRADNPAAAAKVLLPKKRKVQRRAALLDIEPLRDVLAAVAGSPASDGVKLASMLAAYSSARLGNVIRAQWEAFNLDADVPTWTIPRDEMKTRDADHPHVVFLGPTVARALRDWREQAGGAKARGYLFPGHQGRAHITHESLEKLYRDTLKLRGRMSLHGWRSALATLARDAGFSRDVVEMSLDHIHDTEVVRAYDRGERRAERVALARWWDAALSAESGTPLPNARVLSLDAKRARRKTGAA